MIKASLVVTPTIGVHSLFGEQELDHCIVSPPCRPQQRCPLLVSTKSGSCPFLSKASIMLLSPKYAARCTPFIYSAGIGEAIITWLETNTFALFSRNPEPATPPSSQHKHNIPSFAQHNYRGDSVSVASILCLRLTYSALKTTK